MTHAAGIWARGFRSRDADLAVHASGFVRLEAVVGGIRDVFEMFFVAVLASRHGGPRNDRVIGWRLLRELIDTAI